VRTDFSVVGCDKTRQLVRANAEPKVCARLRGRNTEGDDLHKARTSGRRTRGVRPTRGGHVYLHNSSLGLCMCIVSVRLNSHDDLVLSQTPPRSHHVVRLSSSASLGFPFFSLPLSNTRARPLCPSSPSPLSSMPAWRSTTLTAEFAFRQSIV